MALRAPSIQRKSIHRFSTGPRLGALALAPAIAVLGGCAGGGAGPPSSGDPVVLAVPQTVRIAPHGTGRIRFFVSKEGSPLPGEEVTFMLSEGAAATGAALARPSARSDADGMAEVQLMTGQATTLRVRGDSGRAGDEAVVIVAEGSAGSVVVVPFFTSPDVREATSRTEVMLIDGRVCRDVPSDYQPPSSGRKKVEPSSPDDSARFDEVGTGTPNAVFAQALDSSTVPIAAGCVDLPGSSLIADGIVQLLLPLEEIVPEPLGAYQVTSELALSPPLEAARRVAAPWRDLADCPLDPAEVLLDCTADALTATAAGQPVDCLPDPAPAGALAVALAARRGAPLLDRAGLPTGCRAATDASRRISADAIVMGMFGSPLPAPVVSLPAIADDAAHLLDRIGLASRLTLRPGAGTGQLAVTHTLTQVHFGPAGARVSVDLTPLALPVLVAETAARIEERRLIVDRHGFTLRLGAATRAAFGLLALERRGLPGDVAGLIAALATLARSPDGKSAGCAAIDAVLCPEVGERPGCLAAACLAGLDSLAGRLVAAFSVADGTDLDLHLAGTAPLIDVTQVDRTADQLGDLSDPARVGIWSVDLRTSLGRRTFTAPFQGNRISP